MIGPWKLPKNANEGLDFTRLTNEQYIAFRHAFVEERMYDPTYKTNKGQKAMDLILSALCMIMCNKLPKGVVPFSLNSII